jgi:hypothetical protein
VFQTFSGITGLNGRERRGIQTSEREAYMGFSAVLSLAGLDSVGSTIDGTTMIHDDWYVHNDSTLPSLERRMQVQ